MNDAERGELIKSPHELQEELSHLAERTVVGGREKGNPERVTEKVPNDEGWSSADILSGIMAGQYGHGVCVEVYGYKLYNVTVSDDLANVWRVHPPDDVDECRAIDAVNVDHFRTASEFESFLLEGLGESERDEDSPWEEPST
jgi:hypothetical protein